MKLWTANHTRLKEGHLHDPQQFLCTNQSCNVRRNKSCTLNLNIVLPGTKFRCPRSVDTLQNVAARGVSGVCRAHNLYIENQREIAPADMHRR